MSNKDRRGRPSDEELRTLYVNDGLTMSAIAEKFGTSPQRIQQRLAALGISGIRRRVELDRETLRSMFVDLRLTKAEIAEKLGVTKSKVKRELERYGIARPIALESYASRYPRQVVEDIYVREGLFQTDAAARLGIPTQAFQKLLHFYGINQRHSPGRKSFNIPEEDLRRLYTIDAVSPAAIAEQYGCSPDTIRARLREIGIVIEFRRDSKLPDDATIRTLYLDEGLTLAQIGTRYGVTPWTVHSRLRRIGIRRRDFRKLIDPATLTRLYVEQKLSQGSIATLLGVPKWRVSRSLLEHGIERHGTERTLK